MASKELIIPADGDIAKLKDSLLDSARASVFEKHGNVHDGGPELEAEVMFEALCATVMVDGANKSLQMHLVAHIGRENTWQFHPEGYDSLRDFLKAAGLPEGRVSRLTFVGDKLVNYCDAKDIPVDHLLGPDHRAKIRSAIPVLRGAIDNDDEERVKEVLEDVQKAKSRKAIRGKYTESRDKYGRGTTVALPDGRVLLLALLDDDEATKTIVNRMSGGIKWELVADAHKLRSSVRVMIDDGGNATVSQPGDRNDDDQRTAV